MLHKSFKPAKCKTSLKLASSRLKLLKNKKEVQVKQMKRELAQLLESGQDQTARIRVEHVVREEKMMAAYELVEIYCELIVARLSIIESQKNCPIDLKEAVSSVVFASPRCADVPELMDIRKHFTAKYGKDFISAAVELRPDCGVSRTLVEKLSAKAPDGPTKVRILTSIAEEHNIKWDPKSFGDKDSHIHEDLLNGPSTFEKASKLQTQVSNFQVPHNDRERTNVHVAAQNVVNDDASVNLHENNSRSSFGHQIIPPGHDNSRSSFGHQNIPPGHANVPATSHPEPKTPGNAMEGAEAGHAYHREENVDNMGRQNWNMEFKDATSAAQAAAESAERASMAARAAAQLSSRGRISTQYSTEPQRSSAHGSMDEWAGRAAGSSFQNEAYAKVAGDRAFNGRNAQPHTPNKQNYAHEEHIGGVGERFHEDGHMSNNRPSQYASTRSHMEPMDNNSFEKSSSYGTNNERSERYMNPKSEGGFSGRVPVNDTFEARIPSMHRGQPDVGDNDRLAGVNERPYRESNKRSSESSRSNSRKSSADFSGVDSLVNEHEMAGRNTQNSFSGAEPGNVLDKSSVMGNYFRPETSGILDELSERRNSGGSEVESANDLQDDFIFAKHSTDASYHSHSSHSSTFSDNREVMSNLKEKDDVAENPFADFDEENFQKDNKSAIESTAVVFDDYGSDYDDYGFDLDKGAEPSAKTSQPSWESPSYPSASIGLPSPKRTTMDTFPKITPQSSFSMNQHDPIFSRGLADSSVHPQADELEPLTFDESNGPSSESEDERSNYKEEREYSSLGSQKKFGFGDLPSSSGKSSFNSKNKGLDTSDDPVDKKHQSQSSNAYEDAFVHEVEESAFVFSKPGTIDDSKSPHEDSYDSGLGLAFGRLTGGLKNKGNRHPSYLSSAGDASLSKQTAEHTAKETSSSFPLNTSADSVVQQDPESEEVGSEFKKRPTRGPAFTSFGSVSDQIPEETVPQENSRSRRQRQVQKMEQEADDTITRRASTRPIIPSLGPSGVYASERTTQGQISDSHPEPYSQQQSEVDERSKSSGGSSASYELREEQRGLRTRRERYIEKMQQEVDDNLTRRASTRPVIPSLGSDGIYASEGTMKEQINDSGSEPYTKEESEANKRSGSTGSSTNSRERIGPGLSRRTKAGAPSTHRSTNLKSTFASDESKEHSADSRSSLRSSYPTGTSRRPHSAADEAYSLRGSEHSRYGKEAKGKPISETRSSSRGESLKSIAKEQPSSSISKKTSTTKSGMSEDGLKSIAREQPSLPIQKKVSSAKSETSESSKATTPSLGSASREDSFKRASHVHPKLPDYDTFAATLQSLRANRK